MTAPSPALPPGPRGSQTVRVFLDFFANPTTRAETLRSEWGDIVGLSALGQTLVLLFDPALIGEVLLDKEGHFHKDVVTQSLGEVLGEGLVISEEALWKRQRKLIAPSLTKKQVSAYAQAMITRSKHYAAARRRDEVRDIHEDMTQLTLDIVVDTLFGSELPNTSASLIGREVDGIMADFITLMQSWRRLVPTWVPFAARRRMRRASRSLDAVVRDLILHKRREGATGDDLLSRLIAARDDDGSGMSDRQLRDEVMTMVLAGHETTATALSFALYLLATTPSAIAELRRERERVVGDRDVRFEDLPKLVYAEAVFREVLRLYPSAYLIGRQPMKDVTISGYRIPRGAQILMSPWAMHRDARYFDNPQTFRPERWLEGLAEKLPKNAYLPFGGGPRVCVGNHFAMMEGALVLTTLCGELDFETTSETRAGLVSAITLRPAPGLVLRVRRRH